MPMPTTMYAVPPARSPEYIDLFLYLFIFYILYEYLILKSESVREKSTFKHIVQNPANFGFGG